MESNVVAQVYPCRKALKKAFKAEWKIADPTKTKEVSIETASKMVVSVLEGASVKYTLEDANKLLARFDFNSTNMNTKKEVKKAIMVAANLERIDEAYIQKMKKKWIKKQKKKANSTPEMKLKRKNIKKVIKTNFQPGFKALLTPGSKTITLAQADQLIRDIWTKTGLEVPEGEIEVLQKMDWEKSGTVNKKDCEVVLDHVTDMKEIDFDELESKQLKWKANAEKKKAKKALKLAKKAPAPTPAPVEGTP